MAGHFTFCWGTFQNRKDCSNANPLSGSPLYPSSLLAIGVLVCMCGLAWFVWKCVVFIMAVSWGVCGWVCSLWDKWIPRHLAGWQTFASLPSSTGGHSGHYYFFEMLWCLSTSIWLTLPVSALLQFLGVCLPAPALSACLSISSPACCSYLPVAA